MSQRIQDMGIAPQPSSTGAEQPAEKAGAFMGDSVKVMQDTQSLIADAAEELTLSTSEDVERKLTDRKEGRDKAKDMHRIMFYVEKASDISQSDLEQLMKKLSSMAQAKSADIVAMIRQSFSDPTNQHAALSYAGGKLEELDLPDEQKAALRKVLSESVAILESENGQAINAGYNIAGVEAPGLGISSATLRVLYRDTVIDFENYENTFSSMLQKFGPEEFPKAVDFLIRALGNDMGAMTPSCPKAALKEVMDGLYMVESLGTIYKDANKLLQGAEERHGAHAITERAVIEPLLRYKEIPVLMPMQITQEMPFLISENPVQDAELTQGIREMARKMPHKLYSSQDVRQNVLNAFQEVLDAAADREEMMEE